MLREYFIVYSEDSDSFSAWGLIFWDVSLTTAAHCKVAHGQHELDPHLYSISVAPFLQAVAHGYIKGGSSWSQIPVIIKTVITGHADSSNVNQHLNN